MKADPSAQVRLLDLQDLDARADQLRHQRRSLPEAVQLSELTGARTATENQARDARIVVSSTPRFAKVVAVHTLGVVNSE